MSQIWSVTSPKGLWVFPKENQEEIDEWMDENVHKDWAELRQECMSLLQDEANLQEIVRLVGIDALSEKDNLLLLT